MPARGLRSVFNSCRHHQRRIIRSLSSLYLDTAATAFLSTLRPALTLVDSSHLLYGSDAGTPCTSEVSLSGNLHSLMDFGDLTSAQIDAIGRNARNVLPSWVEPSVVVQLDARHLDTVLEHLDEPRLVDVVPNPIPTTARCGRRRPNRTTGAAVLVR